MKRGTKYVGVSAQLVLALALSGCGGAEDDANSGNDSHEVGAVTQALTQFNDGVDAGQGAHTIWDGVDLYLFSQDSTYNPRAGGWSVWVNITNNNPARVHIRRLQVDLTCSADSWGSGATTTAGHTFSSYINGNGGTYDATMICPWGFGYPYMVHAHAYGDSSFGD